MSRIITIGREFGSGGRELGKRLADALGYAYYDKEFIEAVMSSGDTSVTRDSYFRLPQMPYQLTIGRTFARPSFAPQAEEMLLSQSMMRKLAQQGNAIFMGQGADVILKEYHPFNMFVYADMPAKIRRCQERRNEGEHFTDQEMERKILQVDSVRAKKYRQVTSSKWGIKENYCLCVNTTNCNIKAIVPVVADYIKIWFSKFEGESPNG